MVRRWVRLLLVMAVMVGLGGCGRGDGTEGPVSLSFVNWPAQLDGLRFRWSAEPGIDLLNGPAIPLRGYLESRDVTWLVNDAAAAYPGYDRAVVAGAPEEQTRSGLFDRNLPMKLRYVRTGSFPELTTLLFFGNVLFHVLELTPIESGYRAYVCAAHYRAFWKNKEGQFLSLARNMPDPESLLSVAAWRVEFSDVPPVAGAPTAVTGVQRGPNPAPLGDVFGPWQITGASPEGAWGLLGDPSVTAELEEHDARVKLCVDRMPDSRDQIMALISQRLDSAPSALPAVPGWPAEGL